ncbi:MAG TPA: hypothetical protein VLK34_08610 [Nocardioidaceae bacterium]|nr:hypothetical protein [Nocardioidaceae bacterium]
MGRRTRVRRWRRRECVVRTPGVWEWGGDGANGGGPTGQQDKPAADQNPGRHRQHHDKPAHHRPVAPSGPCAPTDVDISVVVHDSKAGHANPVGLKLTSVGTPACTLAITSDSLALRITSGSDVVWSSDSCPNAILARELVIRAHKPVVYTFDWDGRRSTETCAQAGKVAEPGGYWAEAALIGADVHRAYFDVT